MSKLNRRISPVIAGLAVLAIPALSQTVQAQSYPVTQYGDHGQSVKAAEVSLKRLGYYRGAIDSAFGAQLLAAVKSFQGHYGLSQDGILGPLTWNKLDAAVNSSVTKSNTASPDFSVAAGMLTLGSSGSGVVHVQELLNQYGYHLVVDGNFGPLTYSAVRSFQASHGLSVDGIVGPDTLNALTRDSSDSSTASETLEAAPPTYPPGYLHEGDTGTQVATLQSDLTRLGYSTGGVDGVFGPVTLQAVEAFQSAHGLPAHGLVGTLTWDALNEALSSGGTTTLSNRGSVSPTATAIVGIAMKYQGYPYYFGGNTPSGFDCSGFVQWVYSQVGISLPRTSFAQWDVGTRVSYDQLEPGDLVFFTTDGVFANHVGIYLGGGEFISAASPGQGVVVQSLSTAYFAQSFDGGVQVIN